MPRPRRTSCTYCSIVTTFGPDKTKVLMEIAWRLKETWANEFAIGLSHALGRYYRGESMADHTFELSAASALPSTSLDYPPETPTRTWLRRI